MRIAIDASRANLDNKTGVEWYSYNLIESLKKIDHENQYFLYSQNELKNELAHLPDNFYTRVLPWNKKGFWTQLNLWKHANFDKNRVLFIPSGMIPILPFRRYKLITTIHDICFFDHPEYYSKKDLFIQKLAFKFATLFCDRIITVSEFTKSQILKHSKYDPKKIIVTHLGFDHNVYKKEIDQEYLSRIKTKYNLPDKYLLYIGRIEDKKNILNQIKAFNKFNQKYPEYKFVLIGKPGYGYDSLKTEIFKNDLQKNIIELGWIKQQDMTGIINMASVFMFVSNYEGFGIPIIEAMASGVPVVTSNKTSIPEVACDAALYSEPNNILKIYENLCAIEENKDNIKEELIKKGFERIKDFTWEKCAKETLLVIKDLRKRSLKEIFNNILKSK